MLASKSALSLEEECPSLTPTEGNPVIATEVQDLILTILKDHPYDQLKASLIKRTAASEQRRLQQVFHSEELGDRKPSQLLHRLQQLLGDSQAHISPPFLWELFLQ